MKSIPVMNRKSPRLSMPACLEAVVLLSALPAFAQVAESPLQKQLATMQAGYEKAVTTATAPIDRSYLMALEKLAAQAAQQKDEAAAGAIAAEILSVREQQQTEAALLAALVGSRWKWFSSSDLVGDGKAFIDFYRDGVARTSWGSRVTYAIKPPASLRISQQTPKQDWYFAVDLLKKQALPDPFFSEGHEKRSLSWDRNVSPVEPKTPPKPAY